MHRELYRDHWIQLFAALASVSIATAATAEEITFDEILPANSNCCYLTTEYVDLGVTFVTTDDGSIWAGLSNGNPGSWYLEGTNGPAFLGFNGVSLTASLLFDTPVSQFRLDMAPTIGWYDPADLFIVDGYRNGVLVESVSTPPLDFAEWMTVELTKEVDEVQVSSIGPTYPNAYGIDNIQWLPVTGPVDPEVPGDDGEAPTGMSVEMEVNPGHDRHHHHRHHRPCFVDLFSRGLTRVAIFGSDEFDVNGVDVDSLGAGPDMAGAEKYTRVRDVNRDGIPDLLTVFRTRALGLAFGESELCVTGMTVDGQTFEGCDEVDTMPFKRHEKRSFHH
jgi:hypothetical protein